MNDERGLALAVIEPDQERELRSEIAPVVHRAQALMVRNAAEFEGAALFLKGMKASQKKVVDFFAPMKEAAKDAHSKICAAEKSFLDPLRMAESAIKGKMSGWQIEEERKAEKERLRLQAEADERARKDRERLEKMAAKAAEKGKEEKAEALQEQAETVVAPVVQVQSAAPKIGGISTRKVWKATVTNTRDFLAFAAQEPTGMFIAMVEVSETMLGRIVKGDTAPVVPGVEFRREVVMSSGRR